MSLQITTPSPKKLCKPIPFSRALCSKNGWRMSLPHLLKVQRIFNFEISTIIRGFKRRFDSSDVPRFDPEMLFYERMLRRLLFKNVTRVSSSPKCLPYYMPKLRSSLRKLEFGPSDSSPFSLSRINYSKEQQRILRQKLSGSKHLSRLEFSQPGAFLILLGVRKLRKLKTLKLTLSHNDLEKCDKIFRHLTSLKVFSLNIYPRRFTKNSEPENILLSEIFFKNLLKIRSLQVLNLNLLDSLQIGNLSALETVFSYIVEAKVPVFDIKVAFLQDNGLNIEKSKEFLAQVEFLNLIRSVPIHMTAQAFQDEAKRTQKSLSLNLPRSLWPIVASILKECTSLRNLGITSDIILDLPENFVCYENFRNIFIEVPRDHLKSHVGEMTHPEDALSETNVVLDQTIQKSIHLLSKVEQLDFFSIVHSEIKEANMVKFKELHNFLLSKNLKSYCLAPNASEEALTENIFTILLSQISSFNYLKSLLLSVIIEPIPSLRPLEELLCQFSDLKNLSISIMLKNQFFPSNNEEIIINLPVDKLSNIKTLRFDIPHPLEKDCAKNLLNNIIGLKELECLSITRKTLNNLNDGSYNSLLKNLTNMENLMYIDLERKGIDFKKTNHKGQNI